MQAVIDFSIILVKIERERLRERAGDRQRKVCVCENNSFIQVGMDKINDKCNVFQLLKIL